jgi:hypothetical protein
MEFIKKFLSNKKPGWYVSVVALILALITVIVYTARGGNYLSPVSSAAVTLLVFGIITNVLALVADFKVLAFLPMAFYAATVAVLLNTEMLYITNVAFGVDGNSFDGGFFTFLVTDVLAMLLSAVAFGMGLSKSNKIIAE